MTVCLLHSSNKFELTEVQLVVVDLLRFFSSGYPAMNENRLSDGVDAHRSIDYDNHWRKHLRMKTRWFEVK